MGTRACYLNISFLIMEITMGITVPYGRQKNALSPEDFHVLNPQTCQYVTLCAKESFLVKLGTLRREDYPGLSCWIQWNHES